MHDAFLLARCALTAVFLASAAMKLASLPAFDDAVRRLGGVPERWARTVGLGTIGAELVTVLLLAVPGTARYGFGLGGGLLAVFSALIVRAVRAVGAVRAGGEPTRCACFGTGNSPVGRVHLVRNALLLAMAAVGLATPASAASWHVAGTAPVAAAVGLLLALLVVLAEDLAFLFGWEG